MGGLIPSPPRAIDRTPDGIDRRPAEQRDEEIADRIRRTLNITPVSERVIVAGISLI